MMIESFDISHGSLSPLKRKREEDSQRKIKAQKLSHSLSSQLARSLTFAEDESNDEGESLNTQEGSLESAFVPKSINLPRRNLKYYSKRFGGKCFKQLISTNDSNYDMEIMSDHSMNDLSGGEDRLVHEPAR